MSQHLELLSLMRSHGGSITLGEIMRTTLAAEYRARMTELRKQGYAIVLERGKTPSENRYRLIEQRGQLSMDLRIQGAR